MVNQKAPEIRMVFSIDGKVKEVDVVSDSPEDRDLALGKLRQILPSIELIESLLRPEPSTLGVLDVQYAGIK
jgi:hypothetical protein